MTIKHLCTTALLLMHLLAYSQQMHQYSEEEVKKEDKYLEALSLLLTQQPEKAEPILIDLYKDDRSNASVAMALSQTYEMLEDPANQHRYAKTAAENAPSNEHILKTYGEVSLTVAKYAEAVTVFAKLAKDHPQSEEYTDLLATAHLYLNEYKEAIAAYNRLQSAIGIKEDISRRKFEVYEIINDQKAAVRELEALTEAQPYNVDALHILASYHEKMGNAAAAKEVYKDILAVDINDTKANVALMSTKPEQATDGNYLRALAPIIDNANIPVDAKVLELIPYVEKLNETADEQLSGALIELAQRLVANHPKEAKSHAIHGDILFLTGNTRDAIRAYEKTLSLDNSVYAVWEQLMYAYLAQGRTEDVTTRGEMAIDLFPNEASAYYLYGIGARKTKQYIDAIDLLSEGVLVAGRDIYHKSNLLAELSLCYQLKGDEKDATKTIAKALDISKGENPVAQERQGDVLILQGDTDGALSAWKLAARLADSSLLQEKITNKRYID